MARQGAVITDLCRSQAAGLGAERHTAASLDDPNNSEVDGEAREDEDEDEDEDQAVDSDGTDDTEGEAVDLDETEIANCKRILSLFLQFEDADALRNALLNGPLGRDPLSLVQRLKRLGLTMRAAGSVARQTSLVSSGAQ